MDNLSKELEAKEIKRVKRELSQNIYGRVDNPNEPRAQFVKHWIEEKESQMQEEKRTEALRIAKKANRLAIWAIAVAVAAILISIFY